MLWSSNKSDIQWLKDTHLKGKYVYFAEFGSFIIYGNEDYPDRIELYKDFDPHYKTKPFKVFEYKDEEYKEIKE